MEALNVGFLMILATVLGFAVLFLPTVFAHNRRQPNRGAITVLNVCTLVGAVIGIANPIVLLFAVCGWIAALVWAFTR